MSPLQPNPNPFHLKLWRCNFPYLPTVKFEGNFNHLDSQKVGLWGLGFAYLDAIGHDGKVLVSFSTCQTIYLYEITESVSP